ncbi:hypothetical protein M1403_02640 [Patescibacteria group bacterium]|nr:hypothetical protein [Patescibacteria group bacterium]
MLAFLLILLLALWILGYVTIPGLAVPAFPLFYIGAHPVTIWDLLVFAVIIWAASVLPSPIRQIVWVIVVLWLLSILGVLVFAGLPSLLIIAVILGLLIAIF